MPQIGVLVDPIHKPQDIVTLARSIEDWGFASFWYPDEKYFRDCFIGLTLVGVNTNRIRFGPCVVDPFSRHPIQTAVSIASLAELAAGRVWLGIGAGGRGLREIGIDPRKPAVAIRETIHVLRGLLSGQAVNFEGEIISLQNRPLDFQPKLDVPIMIGTGHGRQIKRLAGEVADAVMLANYSTPGLIDKELYWIKEGAQKAGRSLQDINLISRVDMAVHADRQVARAAVTPKVLSFLRASYPDLSYLGAIKEFSLSPELEAILKNKDYQARTYYADAANIVPYMPDVLIDHLAICGTPDEVAEKLSEIASMDVFHEITIRPIACGQQTLKDCLELFYREVMPAWAK